MYNNTPTFFTSLLLALPNIGTQRHWQLIKQFGSAEAVLAAEPSLISICNGRAQQLIREYQQRGTESEIAQSVLATINNVEQQGGKIICVEEEDYPDLLKEIYNPPPLLYLKGLLHNLYLPQLALVGSRHASHGGLQNTRAFATHLSQSGFTITSGLALGIDGAAHEAALSVQGTTIAVMATGIDAVYPRSHRYLADQILAEGGTLVTEFAPSTPPKANHFPRRNRIISGLSLGVIVFEAAIKSGSLITAEFALEQGREVFAIPGSIHHPQSKGCHRLIKNGATLIESSHDIIEHLQGLLSHLKHVPISTQSPTHSPQKNSLNKNSLNPEKKKIIDCLGFEPKTIEQLIDDSGLPSYIVTASLMNLEINGWIKRSHWGYERV
jgi:DNA processing protein